MVMVASALLRIVVEDGLGVGVVAVEGEVVPALRAHRRGDHRGDDGGFAGLNGGGDRDDITGVG